MDLDRIDMMHRLEPGTEPEAPTHHDGFTAAVLYVDLDGSLIRTDLLVESALALVKQDPLSLFRLPGWLAGGKARLKLELARRVRIDPERLPYRPEVLALIEVARLQGSEVVLATASAEPLARAVAAHLGCFDRVIATREGANNAGAAKAQAIEHDAAGRAYHYLGDGSVDLAVWRHAEGAIVVDRGGTLVERARALTRIVLTIPDPRPGLRDYLRALRPHQWVKNALVFLPLLPIARTVEPAGWISALLAFVAFSLCASSVYVINDLLDLPADRAHPRKRLRPFASGLIPALHGPPMALVLLAAAVAVAASVGAPFVAALAAYFGLTFAYSTWLKRHVMVDVFVLAALYTMRIIGGSAAIQTMPTFWILGFSMFLFFSLALAKRYVEISTVLRGEGAESGSGRGYRASDDAFVLTIGSAAGMAAVMLLALYVNDMGTSARYTRPVAFWAMCPLAMYWISRVWFKASRLELHDDPIVFALKDMQSRVIGALGALVCLVAI
jgi:4-hydroxybenzoate polyprenyltransferase